MERLIRFFVERHLLVHVIVLVVVTLGLLQASRAPRETFPNVTLPTLTVTGVLPGASARDVETKVTIPIQEAVEELNGLKEFSTVVSDGTSVTIVELADEFDDARVREAERDLRVLIEGIRDFPPEMEDDPTITRLNPKLLPVVQVALAGPPELLAETSHMLERRLQKLEEVSRVDVVGLPDPELRILVDPVRARTHGVTLLDVVDSVRRRNVSSTGGLLESARDRRQVVLWSRFDDPTDVASTVVRFTSAGGALTVADVARIELGREDTGLIAHTNGMPGVSVVVTKSEDADIIDTVDAVRASVATAPIPDQVEYALVRDESFMTRNRLELMWSNGILGALLVAVVLFLFLTPVAAGWTLAGIPVVFLGTMALFPVLGFSINVVTLTGLVVVLGMVVDDAVVVSERITTLRQQGENAATAAVKGAAEMTRPVAASAITTMLAFVPLWGLGGMSGKMVASMPPVIILALSISLLESFTVLPAHLSMGHRRAETGKRAFVVYMEERYRRILRRVLARRALVVASFAAVLLIVFAGIAPRIGVLLFPQDDSEAAYLKIRLPIGTPIERTEAVTTAIERQLIPLMGEELVAATARIGHQGGTNRMSENSATRGSAANEAMITVLLDPKRRTHTSAEWVGVFRERLAVPADAEVVYQAEIMGPPVGLPITLHVASNDHEQRRSVALEVADWLRTQEGVVNVDVDERPGTRQVELVLDYERLALRGLDPEAVGRTVQLAFHGLIASEHRDLDDTTDFRVLLEPTARRSLDDLLEIPVRGRTGELVRLRDVVAPVEVPAVARIYHRDGMRAATVTGQFAAGTKHTALSFARRAEQQLLPRYAGVPELEVSVGGEAVETRKASGDLLLAAGLAFAGIGLVIALMLGSFLEAAFVMAVVPFAIAGVILAFFVHLQPLSMFAMMGGIGLAGVVVNASIVMVDAVHRRVKSLPAGDTEARREAVIDAVVGRLRPIVVTTLTTLGGVLPMAYGIGGRDAVVAPMSLAIGWGLFFSTSVTLLLVPTLYTLASDLRGLELAPLVATLRDRIPRGGGPATSAGAPRSRRITGS